MGKDLYQHLSKPISEILENYEELVNIIDPVLDERIHERILVEPLVHLLYLSVTKNEHYSDREKHSALSSMCGGLTSLHEQWYKANMNKD